MGRAESSAVLINRSSVFAAAPMLSAKGQVWDSEQIYYVLDALAIASSMHVMNAKGEKLLTAREDQVVSLVAEGVRRNRRAIIDQTVKKSLLRIYDKLGVSNRVELVLYALTHKDKYQSGTTSPKHGPTGTLLDSRRDTTALALAGGGNTRSTDPWLGPY